MIIIIITFLVGTIWLLQLIKLDYNVPAQIIILIKLLY